MTERRNLCNRHMFGALILVVGMALASTTANPGGNPACAPENGNCCLYNGTPGCNVVDCCEIVCALDPFCCDTEWDGNCAVIANDLCEVCSCPWDLSGNGFISTGDILELFAQWGTAGSADFDESGAVGTSDLLILFANWGDCPNNGNSCGPGAGNCCVANNTPGCFIVTCCETVCAVDPFCCNAVWDGICANEGLVLCGVVCNYHAPCEFLSGDCCVDNGTPGCGNPSCCAAVCSSDPFCCNTVWDSNCAKEAANLCYNCGGINPDCASAAGTCCESTGLPGCNDVDCCNIICSIDPYCCDIAWDGICANEASALCDICGASSNPACTADSGDCCVSNDTPGCNDVECCNIVCAIDPSCCETMWDGFCSAEANYLCASCKQLI